MKKLINDPERRVRDALQGMGRARRPDHGARTTRTSSSAPTRRSRARSASSPAAAAATSRCTADSSAWACSMRPALARSSPRRCPTRCWRPPRPSTAARACCTSSRTTPATCMNFEMAAELAAAEGIEVAVGGHERRRGGPGQPVHGRPARRRRDRAAGEDRRRGRRGAAPAEGGRRHRRAGQRPGPQHGHGADLVHGAGRRQADLRAGRGRDGDRHRHPRRAGPRAREDRDAAARDRRDAGRPDPRGPAVRERRQRARVRQRHGRHAADRAVRRLQRAERSILQGAGITIARNLVGNYITSLEMAGCSITLLKLDDELTRLWDAPVHTPALRWGVGDGITHDGVAAWIRAVRREVAEQKRGPDRAGPAIGDGDHGRTWTAG